MKGTLFAFVLITLLAGCGATKGPSEKPQAAKAALRLSCVPAKKGCGLIKNLTRLSSGLWMVTLADGCFIIDLKNFRPPVGKAGYEGVGGISCNFKP